MAAEVAARLVGARLVEDASGPAAALRRAWADCEAVIAFLAVGAAVRIVAPLLTGKASDPALVCVDEGGRFAVAVLGGHAAGGNVLASTVAGALGATAVVTTAAEIGGVPALDSFGTEAGLRLDPASRPQLARTGTALLAGEPVELGTDATWPIAALPETVRVTGVDEARAPCLLVTDRLVPPDRGVVYRPPSLVVGLGASSGVAVAEVEALVERVLRAAGLAADSVAAAVTLSAKVSEPGLARFCRERGWPLTGYPAEVLAGVAVPHPSEVVRGTVGTPSVAEAAALHHADLTGGGAPELVVGKSSSAAATVAVARRRPRGRLALVGLGPGARDLLTPRAARALASAAIVLGYRGYLERVRDLLRPGTEVRCSELGAEEDRARTAVDLAVRGHAVALVSGGDPGVYAMASPALEALVRSGARVDVEVVPGVTAAHAAAAVLGSPLGHDHAVVSLSDLLTPWPLIEARVSALAAADFVVALYNPRSRGRTWQLGRALELIAAHRDPQTPAGVVVDAARETQQARVTTLRELRAAHAEVGMNAIVVVGSSRTRADSGFMITPRGYGWTP